MRIDANNWYYSPDHGQLWRVIESQTLWGETTCCVWLPGRDSVVRIPAANLEPLQDAATDTPAGIAYVTAAARVADALTQDVLLAPIESSVIPLPHQIRALSRAIDGNRVRYLLADEVGLGKTIEAGLILRELKLRGLVKRVLVVAPKGLVTQWIAEMAIHFNERFHPILSEDYRSLKRISAIHGTEIRGLRTEYEQTYSVLSTQSSALRRAGPNPFRISDQIVVSMDSVKPSEGRSSAAAHEQFEDLISAGWDLIVVDEAHRLGGSTDQVARFKLGQGLSDAAPYFLLLSATPHQGKTDAFHRLVSLIDVQAFPDVGSVTRDRVQPYVIRTEKRRAITAEGKPLFKPRKTKLAPVSWGETHRDQRLLYEAVTEYVREGYNQAMREKRSYIGFLLILMQRLVVSSTSAIRTTLERRLEALEAPQEQLTLFPMYSDDEWVDLDGQEQIETLLTTRLKALKNERAEVKLLLQAATRCTQAGSDAKAEALLDWLYRIQADEGDLVLKVLVFTEFIPTQQMLQQFLTERSFPVVCLNGSMDMDERKKVQDAFAEDARILISTDAGGEGLNLQFCHVVINYDIPWNPMRLEQRIGRVDRIGQTHVVRAVNFVFEDSVEHRVREVLEEKLAVIFEEFGIDKTGDVLDSALAGQIFDDLYVEAILNPDDVDTSVDKVIIRLQEQVRDIQASSSVLGAAEDLEPGEAQRLLTHPLPHWVERMTVSYLKSHGGQAERKSQSWDRGEQTDLVVVLRSQASDLASLPYDLLQTGRKLSFNLGDIFANLSYPVVTALDRGDLDALYEAQKRHAPGQLGDNATKEFVLRHVFEIAPELIRQSSDLLRVLLRRHYQRQRIPVILDERFIHLLRQNSTFDDWPLETLVPDREAFFAFLQEQWSIFLDREAAKGTSGAKEDNKPYSPSVSGPVDLPFDHHDIQVYIDNLFLEGLLHSVAHDHSGALSKTWVGIGVRTDPSADRSRRIGKLIDSLQAAFAGKAPIFFPNSIQTTEKESALWTQFWADQGLTSNEVVYVKGLGDGSLESLSEALSHPRARVAGLVVDKVDRIMHGMELGTAGMHNQVRQWAGQPFMANLIDLLLDNGFRVFLTSDHGNIEASGCGRPAEGSVADLRGERVRIYSDSLLRGQIKNRFPDALEWPPVGLPEDYLPLLAPGRYAFVRESERLVGHGGISLEELVVPLIQIESLPAATRAAQAGRDT